MTEQNLRKVLETKPGTMEKKAFNGKLEITEKRASLFPKIGTICNPR